LGGDDLKIEGKPDKNGDIHFVIIYPKPVHPFWTWLARIWRSWPLIMVMVVQVYG